MKFPDLIFWEGEVTVLLFMLISFERMIFLIWDLVNVFNLEAKYLSNLKLLQLSSTKNVVVLFILKFKTYNMRS